MNSSYTPFHHRPTRSAHHAPSFHPRAHSSLPTNHHRGYLPQTIHLVLTLLIAIFCAGNLTAQNYAPTDITTPTGEIFYPYAMNDHGAIVGEYLRSDGTELPAVWHNHVFTMLPLLPGTNSVPGMDSGWARGINNAGQIVGACAVRKPDGTMPPQACIWENGTVRALPAVAGADYTAAWAINDAGTIVGHAYTNTVYSPFRQAVIWQGNTVGKLLPPTPGARTWARAIDTFGRVAVSWTTEDEYSWEWHAARWTPSVPNGTTGTMMTLGIWGSAYDINDSGVVSGNQASYGLLWEGTVATELQSPYWGMLKPISINNAGVAVGSNEDTDLYITTALVWDDGIYGRDLNLLLTASTAFAFPGSLAQAQIINGPGQILVYTNTGNYVLLTPSAEPPAPHQPLPPSYVWPYPGDGLVDLYWPAAYYAET